MQKPLEHSFEQKNTDSFKHEAEITAILLKKFPGARQVISACKENDRKGTDYWVEMCGGYWLSIDVKVRDVDFAAKPDGICSDDLALESWSVFEEQIIGWTRDQAKRTDYVLWYWRDTRRSCLVPFQPLCRVFIDRWEEWAVKYKTARQHTPDKGDYHSECVFVPRREVWLAIYQTFASTPKETL